jgi:hypothetical protein
MLKHCNQIDHRAELVLQLLYECGPMVELGLDDADQFLQLSCDEQPYYSDAGHVAD